MSNAAPETPWSSTPPTPAPHWPAAVPTEPGSAGGPNPGDPNPGDPSTGGASLGGSSGEPAVRHGPGLKIAAGIICATMLISGACLISLTLRTGALLFSPGSLYPTEHLITVDNGKAPEPEGGETMFVTISAREATRFDSVIRRRLDPSVEFESRKVVYGGATKKQVDTYNAQAMMDSKLIAQVAAFRQTGLEIALHGKGAEVVQLVPNSPAAKLMREGDVIVAIDGQKVETVGDLRRLLDAHKPGDAVPFRLQRGSTTLDVTATLVKNPDDPTKAMVGIVPQTKSPKFDLPYAVKMDSGDVSGPSAGLAWTLALYDKITPGDLSNGVTFAATGEIAVDGSVGPIGGLPQKAVAVQRASVTDFLIPAGSDPKDVAKAKKLTSGKVHMHPVKNLKEAIAVVTSLKQ